MICQQESCERMQTHTSCFPFFPAATNSSRRRSSCITRRNAEHMHVPYIGDLEFPLCLGGEDGGVRHARERGGSIRQRLQLPQEVNSRLILAYLSKHGQFPCVVSSAMYRSYRSHAAASRTHGIPHCTSFPFGCRNDYERFRRLPCTR